MKIALEAKQRAAKHFKGIENDKILMSVTNI
jgi:hypothetical protein